MATRFWIKLYIEMLDNPKMARLPNHLWRRAVELFLLAGREGNDGALPPVEEMAWILRLLDEKVLEDLQGLEEAGVVRSMEPGKWMVMNFAKWQAAVPVEQRVRQFRERNGGAVVTSRYKRCNEGGAGDSTSTSFSISESDSESKSNSDFDFESDSKSLEEDGKTTPSALPPYGYFGAPPPFSSTKMGEEVPTPPAGAAAPFPQKTGTSRKKEMGEEEMPRTPREAMEHPDVRVFMAVTGGRIPGAAQYEAVIETVRLLREREKLDEAGLQGYLAPYWLAWSSRKRRDGRPYDPGNITWLTEWALNGAIPSQGGSKAPESTRPAVASPEETRRRLAEKGEILKQAVPMPEELREKMRGLAMKKAGKEPP